uniref:Uncharacterized protein n=1 Tax=Anguilla anguilla TaxID=7936 RepID=A0A0E9VTD9_ANGAN
MLVTCDCDASDYGIECCVDTNQFCQFWSNFHLTPLLRENVNMLS